MTSVKVGTVMDNNAAIQPLRNYNPVNRVPMTVNAKAVIVEGLGGCLEKNVTKLLPTEQEWTAANRIEPWTSVHGQYCRLVEDC